MIQQVSDSFSKLILSQKPFNIFIYFDLDKTIHCMLDKNKIRKSLNIIILFTHIKFMICKGLPICFVIRRDGWVALDFLSLSDRFVF